MNNDEELLNKCIFEILNSYKGERDDLIPILQEIQKKFGYLPEKAMKMTADFLQVSYSVVYGVSTFYPFFTFVPTGKNIIKVCRGSACHICGGEQMLRETEKQLGIKPGQSTDDEEYFFDTVACVGACSHSPNIIVNENVYSHITPEKITKIIDNTKRGKK